MCAVLRAQVLDHQLLDREVEPDRRMALANRLIGDVELCIFFTYFKSVVERYFHHTYILANWHPENLRHYEVGVRWDVVLEYLVLYSVYFDHVGVSCVANFALASPPNIVFLKNA